MTNINKRTKKTINWGEVIVIIGLIASLISILTFITGWTNIFDILNFSTNNVDTLTSTPTNTLIATYTPTITLSPTISPSPPTPTSTSVPQKIESYHPGISINVIEDVGNSVSDKGTVQIQFLAGSQTLSEIEMLFQPAEIDVTGNWSARFTGGGKVYETDNNGVAIASLDPGNYAIETSVASLKGNWGIDISGKKSFIFPVFAGSRTEIIVKLGLLRVGVIRNGKAYEKATIRVACNSQDIAGNAILIPCDGSDYSYKWTDFTGVTTLNIGEGEYVIEISVGNGWSTYYYSPIISITSGEVREIIFDINQMQPFSFSVIKR